MTQLCAHILWYRDFYDVPRIFCIRVQEGYLVFDCKFDDEMDDYPPTYRTMLISGPSEMKEEDLMLQIGTVPPITEIAVADVQFDGTSRLLRNPC